MPLAVSWSVLLAVSLVSVRFLFFSVFGVSLAVSLAVPFAVPFAVSLVASLAELCAACRKQL